jgi:hypothetical protein
VGNFIISISLIPLLLALKSFQLYGSVIIIGLSFGLLFELLIRTIEMQAKHHVFLSIIIPIIAVVNVFVIVLYSNSFMESLNIQNPQNPFFVGLVYAIFFMIPYIAYNVFLKEKY